MKQKGFTLAEIMIVLAVIGVLTAILLPTAIHSTPDENVMKFKKANATLYRVISELVNSDQYYLDGDLGVRANGNLVNGTYAGDYTYLCETFADILSVKNKNCNGSKGDKVVFSELNASNRFAYVDVREDTISQAKTKLDDYCKQKGPVIGAEITTTDGIVYYSAVPNSLYGFTWGQEDAEMIANLTCEDSHPEYAAYCSGRFYGGVHVDSHGMDSLYRTFCMDVDGIPNNATASDCVNECPFGYGIRADGKILAGARADEWLKKSITSEE